MKQHEVEALQAEIMAAYANRIQSEVVPVGRGTGKSLGLRLLLKASHRVQTVAHIEDWKSIEAAWSLLENVRLP